MQGKTLEGELLKFDDMQISERLSDRSLVQVRLHGGKNREIRRLLESFGLGVVRLVRTQIGSVQLGGLAAGKWRDLESKEVDSFFALQDQRE